MPKSVKDVLSFLKKRGVEISDDAAAAVNVEFDGQMLASEDKIVKEGNVSVPQKVYEEKTEDLSKWKEKARSFEDRVKELTAALDAGDSDNAKLAEKYKKEYEAVKPLAEKYTNSLKTDWDSVAEKIPEELKSYYRFAAEGKELSQVDLEHNVSKFSEHADLGVLKFEEGVTFGVRKIPPTGKKLQMKPEETEATGSMTDRMATGYTKSGESQKKE